MISLKKYSLNPISTYIQNYFSYYSPEPLFLKGDVNPNRTVPGLGYENPVLGLFYYMGLIIIFLKPKLLKKKLHVNEFENSYLRFFVIIFPVIPAFTVPSGDFQRATHYLPVLIIIVSIGVFVFFHFLKKIANLYFTLAISSILYSFYFIYQIIFYSNYFGEKYKSITDWYFQNNLNETVFFASENYEKYNLIIIDDIINQPYIYVLFFTPVNPKGLTDEDYKDFSTIDSETNWLKVKKFKKYRFRKIDDKEIKSAQLIKNIKNSFISNYSLYEKDKNLLIKFEIN